MSAKPLTSVVEAWLRRLGVLVDARIIAHRYSVDLVEALGPDPVGYAQKRCRGEVAAMLREHGVRSKDIFDRLGFTNELYWLRHRAKQLDAKESQRRAAGAPERRRLR